MGVEPRIADSVVDTWIVSLMGIRADFTTFTFPLLVRLVCSPGIYRLINGA